MASGKFIFADTDVKFDQPQTEVVFDRDKLRSQGVDLSQAGQDLSTMLGGNYVNRFSIQGRSYKVIPQVKRVERLTADQLSQIYVKGSSDKLVPLSTFASLRTTTEPRSLNKFQQLNAVRIQGVIPPQRASRSGTDLSGGPGQASVAAGLHGRLRGRVAPAAGGGQQVSGHIPALGNPDLPGAGRAIRKLPRSFHHSGRFRSAGHLWRAGVFVPGFHDS